MSSFGTNSRPTIRFSGMVSSTVTTEIAMIGRWMIERPVHLPRVPLIQPVEEPAFLGLVIGGRVRQLQEPRAEHRVSVKLTSIDTRIANAIVQPNGLMNRLA